MGVKEKLGNLVKIINTSNGSDQLDNIVWDIISDIDHTNLDYIQYYSTQLKLEYDDFLNVWYNFIKKNILELEDENICDITVDPIKSSLKISLFESNLSLKLENLFNSHIDSVDDDLLLFYLRNENKILLMFKSYVPLQVSDEVRLPYWEYVLEHPKIKEKFDAVFTDKDTLCIMGYSV